MIKLSLLNCGLFEGMSLEQIGAVLDGVNYELLTYSSGDVIVLEGSRLSSAMILVQGELGAESGDKGKNSQKIERIEAPSLIAPSYLFSRQQSVPTTIVTMTTCELLVIAKGDFIALLQSNATVLCNFMNILSAQNSFISDHVVYLTYKTIISKLSNYLLNLMHDQNTTTITNPKTQVQMAEMFGVTRPALARTIGDLVKEGAIYVKGKQIQILFSEKLIQYAKK